MNNAGLEKVKNTNPYWKSMVKYFEKLFDNIPLLNETPSIGKYYKNRLLKSYNNSFINYKNGFEDGVNHATHLGEKILINPILSNTHLKIIDYVTIDLDQIDTIKMTHSLLVDIFKMVELFNNECFLYKQIRQDADQVEFAEDIILLLHNLCVDIPYDAIYCNLFGEYMKEPYKEDKLFVYEEYNHLGQKEWITFESNEPINKAGWYLTKDIVESYEYICQNHGDIVNLYKTILLKDKLM